MERTSQADMALSPGFSLEPVWVVVASYHPIGAANGTSGACHIAANAANFTKEINVEWERYIIASTYASNQRKMFPLYLPSHVFRLGINYSTGSPSVLHRRNNLWDCHPISIWNISPIALQPDSRTHFSVCMVFMRVLLKILSEKAHLGMGQSGTPYPFEKPALVLLVFAAGYALWPT